MPIVQVTSATTAAIIPAAQVIATAGKKRRDDGRLYADDVLKMMTFESLLELLPSTDAPAIYSIDAAISPLTHARLRSFISDEFDLARFGIGRADRVALLFPNGPELALAFVSVLTYCSCAPLNPASTMPEVKTDLISSGAKVVISMKPEPGLVAIADELDILFVEATPFVGSTTAGLFSMALGGAVKKPALPKKEPSQRQDEAFVLHTSGSTGNKKVVPHVLEDLLVGAVCIAAACELEPSDVCCNQMPLYHIGGIARNVLAPILSGGSVVAMPFFEPSLFWKVASSANATWYYAGPTMHMLILDSYKAASPKPTITLRFVANAAGPLLHTVAEEMRDTFTKAAGKFCSIMPSYGMTECMPISSPPVGFNLEKPGSSGQIVGPKCQIQDEVSMASGVPTATGTVGHIMVKGHPVMRGYSNNPEATAESMDNGWFKTGDMGKMDDEGYLYLTGRSKDVINRGGEIISPIEIEEALQTHPFVKELVAFPTPHDVLQETVGVLVVPSPGVPRIDLKAIQAFAAKSLHPSKWPQVVVYSTNLPKTSTGKAMRTNLDKRLSLPSVGDTTPSLKLHFQAEMVPVGTPIKQPIPCSNVTVDIDEITDALSRPGRDVHVMIGTEGELAAYVTPGSAQPNAVAGELNFLDLYLVPEVIVALSSIPRGGDGAVDMAALAEKVAAKEKAAALMMGGGGGGGSGGATPEASIIEQLFRVTGAMATSEDRLASVGIDSLNMIKLISGLKSAFPEVEIPEIVLLNNPTIGELVTFVESADNASGGTKSASMHMQMDACFGLRTVLCLWIVRSHISSSCDNSPIPLEPPKQPFAWGDLTYIDVAHVWRTTVFVLLAAMTTSMKYENHRVRDLEKVKEFVLPILPLFALIVVIMIPVNIAFWNESAIMLGQPSLVGGFYALYVFQIFSTLTMFYSFLPPLIQVMLGMVPGTQHAWYLGAQTLFLFVFNWMQDLTKTPDWSTFFSKLCSGICTCSCFDCCNQCCKRTNPLPKVEHTKKLWPFLKRLAIAGIGPVCLVGIPRVWLDSLTATVDFGLGAGTGFYHLSSWLRLPQFYQGVVLGQGCLHVELTEKQAKGLGLATDVVVFIILVLILSPVPWFIVVLEVFHVPVMAFVLFGVCRSPGTSRAARALSVPILRRLTPYTYGIYMLHIPLIMWMTFVNRFGIVNVFSGTWDPQWYLFYMGFPSSLHELLVTAECPPSEAAACGPYNGTRTIAERFNLTVSDPPQTLREEFIQKGPGIIGFDYTLSGFTAETLPSQAIEGCGMGAFEAVSLFLAYVFIGIVATMVVHDPCQKWINTHLLGGKKKNKPSFAYDVKVAMLDYSKSILAAQEQMSSLVKEVFASNDGSESWSALFSDAPKAKALPENIKASFKLKAGEAVPTAQEKV